VNSKSRERVVPEIVYRLKPNEIRAFLRGLFTADGTIDGDKAVRLSSTSLKLLKQIQELLLLFGIASKIYENRCRGACKDKWKFKYVTKDRELRVYRNSDYHELVINNYSRKLFMEKIGFASHRKNLRMSLKKTKVDPPLATVASIEYIGEQEVFDATVPSLHYYVTGCFISHNCGEEPLLYWESCNLGSINLEKYVVKGPHGLTVDWEGLARDVRVAVRFLDNVIDANRHPLPQITEANRRTRKVGLGVMGWARMLVRLGIPYDSVDAVYLAWAVAEWIAWNAYMAGTELAREKGSFPAWDPERYRWLHETRPFEGPQDLLGLVEEVTGKPMDREPSEKVRRILASRPPVDWEEVKRRASEYGLRNATYLSIAPTGSISIIAGTSSSIEPLFALAYVRRVAVGTFLEVDSLFIEELRKLEIDEPEVLEEIAETGSIQHLKWIPRKLRRLYRTAHDIDPEWHVLHQAAWQTWVDAGVSKTINLRHDEPPETVWMIYKLAWRMHLKGITVYRDRSKSQQVIYFGIKKEKQKTIETKAYTMEVGEIKPVLVIEKKKNRIAGREEVAQKEDHGTRITMGRARLRLGSGKIKELVAVSEEYAGGCPTCDV
ncbi:MAG: hypothetical protein F7B95_00150, partial [Desulfurococcales archaeon]|nr:hypothetical protein [Desulfurococcales archaeon]